MPDGEFSAGKIKYLGELGAKQPFLQGESVMMTLPTKLVKKYNLKEKARDKSFTFVFLETDKGCLMVPLGDLLYRADNLKDILGFMKLSGITAEDLKLMLEEE